MDRTRTQRFFFVQHKFKAIKVISGKNKIIISSEKVGGEIKPQKCLTKQNNSNSNEIPEIIVMMGQETDDYIWLWR